MTARPRVLALVAALGVLATVGLVGAGTAGGAAGPGHACTAITCTLRDHTPAAPGLTRTAAGAVLTVPVTQKALTLVIRVPARYPASDAELSRFAAGIHVTSDAEPEGG